MSTNYFPALNSAFESCVSLQVIQPTPCLSPSGGSRESFSDVPKHTEQLLPTASDRFRKSSSSSSSSQHRRGRQRSRSSSAAAAAAPIASIRTSCSSCSDDAASTATTVNSSVFADDCCCTNTSLLLPSAPRQPPATDASSPSPASAAGKKDVVAFRDDGDGDDDSGTGTFAVGSFRDLNRRPQRSPSIVGGKNVIVVQADVNPIADSIVNANALSGSLRALYDASKETLF